MKQFSSVYSF